MTTDTRYTKYENLNEDGDLDNLANAFEAVLQPYIKPIPQNKGKTIRQRITSDDTWNKFVCLIGGLEQQPKSYLHGNGVPTGTPARPEDERWTTKIALAQALTHIPDNKLKTCIDELSTASSICDGVPGCMDPVNCAYDPNSTDNSLCINQRTWMENSGACEGIKLRFECVSWYNGSAEICIYAEHTKEAIKRVQICIEGYVFAGPGWGGEAQTESEPGISSGLYMWDGSSIVDGLMFGTVPGSTELADFVEFEIEENKLPFVQTPNEGDEIKLGKIWLYNQGTSGNENNIKILGTHTAYNNGGWDDEDDIAFTTLESNLENVYENSTNLVELKSMSYWGCPGLDPVYPNWGMIWTVVTTYYLPESLQRWQSNEDQAGLWRELEELEILDENMTQEELFGLDEAGLEKLLNDGGLDPTIITKIASEFNSILGSIPEGPVQEAMPAEMPGFEQAGGVGGSLGGGGTHNGGTYATPGAGAAALERNFVTETFDTGGMTTGYQQNMGTENPYFR